MSAIVFYTDYNYYIAESLLKNYAHILPRQIIEKASKFRRWQDRQAFILGRLLIWKGLTLFNYEDTCLARIQINSYGKPYLDQQVFFNLSHAGKYVICAFDRKEIGIDIEEIQPIITDDFSTSFSEEEKFQLSKSGNPLQQFYKFWTIKESVIKAQGKGLSIPLDQVTISQDGTVHYGETTWYVKEIDAFQNYCCVIASATTLTSLSIKKVNFGVTHSIETIESLL